MTDKFIIESFWQKRRHGNCVAVAMIKAAIIKFRYNRVFTKVEKRREYFIITLRSKQIILLSEKEIEKYNRKNGIDFEEYKNPQKKKDCRLLEFTVRLCFAVMVKYIKEYNFLGQMTGEKAREMVRSGGLNTDNAYKLLGLNRTPIHDVDDETFPSLQKKRAVLLYTDYHVVVASSGYYDEDGDAYPLEDEIVELREEEAEWWYQIIG